MASSEFKFFLLRNPIKDATQKQYLKALHVFLDWCRDHSVVFSCAEELEEALLEWFHDSFVDDEDGASQSTCLKATYGLKFIFPSLAVPNSFPRVSRALNNWKRLEPSISWPPMTWELAVSVAIRIALSVGARPAIAVLLSWESLLRVSECLALTKQDVLDPPAGDLRLGTGVYNMSLRIRRAKTGVNQWAQVHNPQVAALVRSLCGCLSSPREKLFPFSAAWLRKLFKTACAEYGLNERYVLHSLRHGKATHLFVSGVHLDQIMIAGRWRCAESAKRYIQAGPALQGSLSAPPGVAEFGANSSLQLAVALDCACQWYETTREQIRRDRR